MPETRSTHRAKSTGVHTITASTATATPPPLPPPSLTHLRKAELLYTSAAELWEAPSSDMTAATRTSTLRSFMTAHYSFAALIFIQKPECISELRAQNEALYEDTSRRAGG
jgi:hypothetical protein